jgi:hypothetical protein
MSTLELEQASRKSKSLFLQKMAYPKTKTSKVVFGCPELGGLGMLDLHIDTEYTQFAVTRMGSL